MRIVHRPIERWPGELTRHRRTSTFSATYRSTLSLLDRELEMLGCRTELVLQVAVRERDIRLDGGIRADARTPDHPGVIVSFESKHGPLTYATDVFTHWQCNLRAIALGLEALRKVDRYGIARSGEQYRGWSALPPAMPMGAAMTVEEAAEILADAAAAAFGDAWCDADALLYADDRDLLIAGAYRDAVKVAHPDAGGDPAEFRRITEARDLLVGAAG